MRKQNQGFYAYKWPRPSNSKKSYRKLVFLEYFKPLGWIVGAGIYLDDIENSVRAAQADLKRQMYRDAAKVLFLILVLLAASLLMVRSTIMRMLRSFDLFSELFRQATENGGCMDRSRLNYLEFHQLVQSVNQVLEDRRKAEKARQESEKQYRQLVESANSIILKWDTTGRIIYINPYGLSLFGYKAEELVGRTFLETIVPRKERSGRNLEAIINDITSDPDRYSSHENENITRDGRRLWVSWNNKGVFDDNGNLREILSIGHDLTEKKALEARLIQAQKMEAVGTLAGGIAHDFNNSLQAILGYIQLILTSKDISQSDFQKLKQVEKAAQKASQLTRQLLTFSRKSESRMQQLDLNRQIRETSLLLKRTISAMIEIKTGKGTGLGLATVYGIIKNHGGHITAQSKPGGGSV